MSVSTFDPSAISVSTKARQFFARKLKAHAGSKIRLSTKKSGCTGYAYVLDYVDAVEADDSVFDLGDGVELAIAADTLDMVRGTEIDLVTEGVNQTIKFNNPNVTAECGCGESFSVS